MKKIVKLTEKDIQKLVQKIIKENDEEFSWVKDLDVSRGEAQAKAKWRKIDSRWGVDMDNTFELMVDNGLTNFTILNDIADELNDQFDRAWENGRDYGRDNDCTCDGCCDDDYIWYESHEEIVDEAREEASREGYSEGRDSRDDEVSELESEIESLKDKISELESEIERLQEEREE